MLNLLCSIKYDCQLLPFFIRYYLERRVDRFIFIVWGNRQSDLWRKAEHISRGFNVVLVENTNPVFNGERDAIKHNFARKQYVEDGDWYVICDLDEFHHIEHYSSFPDAILSAVKDRASAVCGVVVDRVSADGCIPVRLDVNQSLGHQFPLACDLTGILGGTRVKILMARKDVAVKPGHHTCTGRYWDHRGRVYHFKWFGSVVAETLKRLESYERQGLYYRNESQNLYNFIQRNGNRIPVHDPAINATVVKNDPLANLTV